MTSPKFLLAAGLVGCSVLAACVPSADSERASVNSLAEEVVSTVIARLNVMPDLAYAKYAAGIPVVDPSGRVSSKAAFISITNGFGVSPEFAGAVIMDQFVAADGVQTRLVDGWDAGTSMPPTTPPKSLADDIRPTLDRLNRDLAQELPFVEKARKDASEWNAALSKSEQGHLSSAVPGVTPSDIELALVSLRG